MSKKPVIFVLTALLLLTTPFAVHAAKPRPPVQTAFQQTDLSDDETEITLTARVNTDTESLTLFIDLPLEVFLIEGELTWEGPLQAGEEQRITIKVVNSGGLNTVIQGEAKIRLKGGTEFVQGNQLILNQPSEKRSKPRVPMLRKRNGGTILEFPGE